MLIECQKHHFPPLPICMSMLNLSALVTNAIISKKKFGTLRHGLKPLYEHSECVALGGEKNNQVGNIVKRHLNSSINKFLLVKRKKKSRIRETKHLSTDADSSTNAIGGWTKNTPKPNFFEKLKNIQKYAKIIDKPFDQRSLIHRGAWFPGGPRIPKNLFFQKNRKNHPKRKNSKTSRDMQNQ